MGNKRARSKRGIKVKAILPAALASSVLAWWALPAAANHGDIHADCTGNRPVVTSRPPGTEQITVVCVDEIPEFMVTTAPAPDHDPVSTDLPRQTPPDFGGWMKIWLNGRPLKTPYDPVRRIQEPGAFLVASTERVMVPIRFVTEAFGGEVEWDERENQRVRIQMRERSQMIQVWIGEPMATVNLFVKELEQPPILFQQRTFVPVRFLAENLGATVTWDHSNRSVRVELPGATCNNPTYCGEVR